MSLPPPPSNSGGPRPPHGGDPFQPFQPPSHDQPPYISGPPPQSQAGYPGPHSGGPAPWQPQSPPPVPTPAPPQKSGGPWKWIITALALLAVIGVTVAITVSVLGRDNKADDNNGDANGGSPSTTSPSSGAKPVSDVASANDTGPVAVITEDPSCAPMRPIIDTRAAQQKNGWDKRDPSIPASEWTPEVRAQYEAVAQSMKASADQLVPIAKLTTHRVMRELYEQLIAYSRAYADSIPNYKPADDKLAVVSLTLSDSITRICSAIAYGSATSRGPLVPSLDAPTELPPLGNPSTPDRFLTTTNPVCTEWADAVAQFSKDTEAWANTSPDVPASQWSPEQKAINNDVAPVMTSFADKLSELGTQSGNPTLRDFAELSAQYRRAYVLSLPSYVPADDYLASAALKLSGVTLTACEAVIN